jgi:hypothetical protein
MGSILSQAEQKCYSEAEKSGPGEKQAHKPEFMASYCPQSLLGSCKTAIPAPTRVARSELNSTKEGHSSADEDSPGI